MFYPHEKKIDLPDKVLVRLQEMGKKFDLSQIILFGSRARCTNGERSDIDLALYASDVKQYFDILDFFVYWDKLKERYLAADYRK